MVTLEFLKEYKDVINHKGLCDVGGFNYSTLNSKRYMDLKNPELKTNEARKFEEILREYGIVERKTISTKDLKNNPVIKRAGLVRRAGLSDWTKAKISEGKELKPEEKKALAEAITTIAKAF